MNNCLAIQQQWSNKILLVGNKKARYVDPDTTVLIAAGETDAITSTVMDLATKKDRKVISKIMPASTVNDYIDSLNGKKCYAPRPDLRMLLPDMKKQLMSFKQTQKIDILTLDIEVASKSLHDIFNPKENPIISIGMKYNDSDPFAIYLFDEKMQDYYILKTFYSMFHEFNPDIIMVYNAGYDIPYIASRLAHWGLPTSLGRPYSAHGEQHKLYSQFIGLQDKSTFDQTLSYFRPLTNRIGGLRDIIPGRVIYDIYADVLKDQALTGKVKNRRLKTIAKYFNFDAIELEETDFRKMHELIGTEKLIEYNKSDVNITYKIGMTIYYPMAATKAEIMDIPIGNVLNCQSSFIPAVMGMRELTRRNIFPFERNKERYERYSELMYRSTSSAFNDAWTAPAPLKDKTDVPIIDVSKDDDEVKVVDLDTDVNDMINTTFEAAIVFQSDINKGYIDKVYKLDFKSYYPSTIASLNLGPDTTTLVEFREKQPGPLRVEQLDNNITRLYIPDNSYNREVVIDIDNSKTSYYKDIILNFRKARKEKQTQIKELKKKGATEEEIRGLDTFQLAIKVLMNIFFGESGNSYSLYGDLGVAIAIVGFCRDVTEYVCTNIIGYENIIEIDTDGIYVTKDFDENEVNKRLNEYVTSKYGTKDSILEMEKEEFGSGYFIRKKTYVLSHTDGTIETKGSALKGSNKPALFDKAKEIIIDEIMRKKNKDYYAIVSKIGDLCSYHWPNDFMITVKAKQTDSYIKTSHMYKILTACASYIEIKSGDTLEYVYTTKGIKPKDAITEKDTFDDKKYSTYIASLIASFGLEEYVSGQLSLF